ncbi:XrtY-associated glycosyltransferase XYAG1 [Flavisolibacter ginsengisoli]|jgi:glycosyltransferase involved in cell wall biosynthesis|uniref:Glycosyltransferase involved in cell wall bisynthesis n=1 Tax=Flavisolibacter ginsengisoli DSM 18119 TaxID=1121884 RepID=A0A1M5E247_9BACT|nr:glycosyltransferase [Flavisolibacter ginsengisoli]SHF73275.1 Glycosyltransferase involved in cell wall bisynthesis [Flavisolibacter ginsengisoli DSM 18119]
MKVLHITPTYKPAYIYGGPIASVSKLCEIESKIGVEISVVTTNANGSNNLLNVETNTPIIVDGIKVHYFKNQITGNIFISIGLWKYVFKHCKKFDVVHIHSWWNLLVIISCLICKIRGVKVIISPRGMLNHYIFNSGKQKMKKFIHFIIGRRLLSNCTFHATSEQEYNDCKTLIKNWNGFRLPNIIEFPKLEIQKSINQQFTITFLSRIHQVKGLEFLFEALSLVDIPFILKIAGRGDDDYVKQLKQFAISLGIEHKIEWIGWCDQNKKYLELMNADMFVLTSYTENFACAVIESLYMGTPVLITNSVGLSNFVKSNGLGWISELNSESIAKSIIEANKDKGKRHYINSNGRKIVEMFFQDNVLGSKYLEEYHKVVAAN